MRLGATYDTGAVAVLSENHILSGLLESLEASELTIERGCTTAVKSHFKTKLENLGWVGSYQLNSLVGVSVNFYFPGVAAVQIQTGNSARAFYDLLKLQSLFDEGVIRAGILIVFHAAESKIVNGNVANYEAVVEQHQNLFRKQIDMPLLILGIGK